VVERKAAEYRLTPAAERDLDEIFDYTVGKWGREQALRYMVVIEKACARSAEAPDTAQDCGYIRAGYRRAIVHRHAIYFRVEQYGIAVIRILHQRMEVSRRL
jgi:toxin ParE1/3/4